jgi:uncharacterized protein (DUF2141 family)
MAMGQNNIYRFFGNYGLVALIASFLVACAQVGSPTGGAKDETAPQIVKSYPENNSVKYTGKSITMTFDEFVQIKDVTNQLLISPPLAEPPQVKIKGKSIVLTFEDELKDSTTYTFNFGNSIADYNEGNPLDSNVFVFSTGNFLDSLSISGTVKNILDGSTEKDIYVMLYNNLEDSIPYKEKPLYLTRTKQDGSFSIHNIKNGTYRIFALKDLNNNIIFDQPTELIAFSDKLIKIDSAQVVDLVLFEEPKEKQFVRKTEVAQYGKVNLIFNRPVDSLFIYPISHVFKKEWYLEERGQNNDTISIWLTDLEEGLESIQMLVKDYNTITDTVNVKIGKKEKTVVSSKMGRGKPTPLLLEAGLNADLTNPLFPDKKLQMTFAHPISAYDFSNAKLTKGEDTLKFAYQAKGKQSARVFEITHAWQEDSTYQLFIPPGAFKDIFDLENDTLRFDFKMKSSESLGNLSLTLKVPERQHQFILQLCKDKTTVLSQKTVKHGETVDFDNLAPGSYLFKIIYDENNNGKWDSGKYLEQKQPEKILYYTGDVTIRANWDLDLEWDLEETAKGVKKGAGAKEESKEGY